VYYDPEGEQSTLMDFVDVSNKQAQFAKTVQAIGFENFASFESLLGPEVK
jgi:hypothetical protein